MPTPPAAWESATPVFGIRYPKPTAPAKYLADMFQHTGLDVEQALLSDGAVPPGLSYVTGTKAQRIATTPAPKDQIWVESDTGDQYIGTGTGWLLLVSPTESFLTHTGYLQSTGDVNGFINIPVPVAWQSGGIRVQSVQITMGNAATDPISLAAQAIVWNAYPLAAGSTQVQIRIRREDTNTWFANNTVNFHYLLLAR